MPPAYTSCDKYVTIFGGTVMQLLLEAFIEEDGPNLLSLFDCSSAGPALLLGSHASC